MQSYFLNIKFGNSLAQTDILSFIYVLGFFKTGGYSLFLFFVLVLPQPGFSQCNFKAYYKYSLFEVGEMAK